MVETIRFLKKSIKVNGKKYPVIYSKGGYTKQSKIKKSTITIYAKGWDTGLPKQLSPTNNSNMQEDYFERDKARVGINNKYYNLILKAMK